MLKAGDPLLGLIKMAIYNKSGEKGRFFAKKHLIYWSDI
jgi:hypothetical protein